MACSRRRRNAAPASFNWYSTRIDMLLTGKKIYADKAKKIGLVDKVTTKESLLNAAIEFANELIQKPIRRIDKRSLLEKDA